jgi:hypothetical protein
MRSENRPKASIAYVDFAPPKGNLSLSEILSDPSMGGSDILRLSRRMLGGDYAREYLIETLGPMANMYQGDRKAEGGIFAEMLSLMFASGAATPSGISHIIYTRGDSVAEGDPWALHTGQRCVNVPYYLQSAMEMSNAVVFNIEQECTGTFTALTLAKLLIESGKGGMVLIIAANYFEPNHKRLMGGSIFVGDGQGLLLVSRDRGFLEIVDDAGRTDGSINSVNSFLDPANQKKAVDVGVDLIRGLLAKNALSVGDISLLIPLNTSKFPWRQYTKLLELPMDRVFLENIGVGGHLGDVDLIRNLATLCGRPALPGSYSVAYGVSTGTSWSALLLRASPEGNESSATGKELPR